MILVLKLLPGEFSTDGTGESLVVMGGEPLATFTSVISVEDDLRSEQYALLVGAKVQLLGLRAAEFIRTGQIT